MIFFFVGVGVGLGRVGLGCVANVEKRTLDGIRRCANTVLREGPGCTLYIF